MLELETAIKSSKEAQWRLEMMNVSSLVECWIDMLGRMVAWFQSGLA